MPFSVNICGLIKQVRSPEISTLISRVIEFQMSGAKDEGADQLTGVTSHSKTTNLKPGDHLTRSPQQLVEDTVIPALLLGGGGSIHACWEFLGTWQFVTLCWGSPLTPRSNTCRSRNPHLWSELSSEWPRRFNLMASIRILCRPRRSPMPHTQPTLSPGCTLLTANSTRAVHTEGA